MDIKLPLSALALPATDTGTDTNPTTAPAVGDAVDLSVTATVTAIDGETASLTLESANGEPISGGGAEDAAAEETPDDEIARMEKELDDEYADLS